MIGEGGRGADRLAVDAAEAGARGGFRRGRLDAGAERGQAKHAFDLGGDRPRCAPRAAARAIGFGKRHLLEGGAAQATPRHQERDRFDQVGFAGAIRPGEHDEIGADVEARRVIAAEVGQRQAAERGGGHGVALKQPCLGLKSAWVRSGPRDDKRYTRIGIRT